MPQRLILNLKTNGTNLTDNDQIYNSTNIHVRALPNCLFIFGAVSSTGDFGYFFYNCGGYFETQHLLVYRLVNNMCYCKFYWITGFDAEKGIDFISNKYLKD